VAARTIRPDQHQAIRVRIFPRGGLTYASSSERL
jgi:hypothetical protein